MQTFCFLTPVADGSVGMLCYVSSGVPSAHECQSYGHTIAPSHETHQTYKSDAAPRDYAATLCVAGKVAKSCHALLWKDDRLVTVASQLPGILVEERHWAMQLSDAVWVRLHSGLPGRPDVVPFRHTVITAVLKTLAGIDRRVLGRFDTLPLSMVVGNMAENVRDA